ncbi:hypothetical protein GCM10007938_04280 [Vibrio zhanjiangensis]|uniref:Uncharacterized protein n=1 Tax=Vibrio zhanjiangensis TaxID=1046128 RepID=A0ABQ6EUI4_9VIBR|nr:hypothetical protein [Vibrio zhanjiangensis]GLT16652.1 hypothetical protein GCM10007938_04280 [Vibrio zhanjiangensis]
MFINNTFSQTSVYSNPSPKEANNNQLEITNALYHTATTGNAKCLVVGYSPTGGGHTSRTLNIVKMALEKNKLPYGSSVIFHVPPAWPETSSKKSPLTKPLLDLCRLLAVNNIHVILSQCDKPIYGYLTENGGSDDPQIMRRLASYPQRQVSDKTLLDARLFNPNSHESVYGSIPIITAKNLFSTLTDTSCGSAIAKEKIYVLTDMAPDLQKAASKHDISKTHRIDQQNHAIMLKPDMRDDNAPQNALLAKVLGGTGEQISHIGLGEKNTLSDIVNSLKKLGITANSTLEEARQAVYNIALSCAKTPEEVFPIDGFTGVITGDKSISPEHVKGITYVYAHKKNNAIIEHIINGINKHKPEYKNHLFVICGAKAIPGHNALHLSYIADANGITTAGAGTVGESVYLHTTNSSKSHLLVLPIENHNEQEANTLYLQSHSVMNQYVTSGLNKDLTTTLSAFFKRPLAKSSSNIKPLYTAIQSDDTYVKQACDTLFGDSLPNTQSNHLSLRQQTMRRDIHLTAHRRYFKLVAQIEDNLAKDVARDIKLTTNHQAISQKEALSTLMNTPSLARLLGTDVDAVQSLPLLEEIRGAFLDNISTADRTRVTEKLYQFPNTGF